MNYAGVFLIIIQFVFCTLKADFTAFFCCFYKFKKKDGQRFVRTSPRDSCAQIHTKKLKKRTFSPIMLL